MKKNYIRNSIIAALVIGLFLMFDLVMKSSFFENHNQMKVTHDWKVIGIRSLAHNNSTFLSFVHVKMDRWLQSLIAFTIAGLFIVWIIFAKSKLKVVALSIVIAGVLGNGFDTAFYGYVRDIIFTPWRDKGTFNVADVLIVVGVSILVLSILIDIFKKA